VKSFKLTLGQDKELHRGQLFWHTTTERAAFYPALIEDQACQIAIIGGGMSGAILAHQLSQASHDIIVVDKLQPGIGSSLGNTGIIQYHSDRALKDFIRIEGEQTAKDFYQLCHDAMKRLDRIIEDLGAEVGYQPLESVYITHEVKDASAFKQETKSLIEHGFPAEYLSREALARDCGLVGEHGLITRDDAMINPFKLIQALHEDSLRRGVKLFGNTIVKQVSRKRGQERITIETAEGHHIVAERVIFCTGYLEDFPALKNRDQLHSTYSVVTQPIKGPIWPKRRMVWDAADPYLYFRVTEDDRLIAGGLDETTDELSDMTTILQRAEQLLEQVRSYYPSLEAEPYVAWQSVFGVSRDELPFIGQDPKLDQVYYALGFGGNGTCYSVAAADILSCLIEGREHPYAYVVDPAR